MTIARSGRAACVVAATAVLTLTSCSGSEVASPTSACAAAFDQATAAIEVLYDTHPFYGSEYDEVYADGNVTAEEQLQIDAWLADEEVQYAAIIEPLYGACDGTEDFYAGAYHQGDKGGWALQEPSALSRAESKEIFLNAYCGQRSDTSSCAGHTPS